MAYRNLVLQACTSKAEVFARIRDFICARAGTYDYSTTGIGWSLHDSSYAVDEDNPEVNDWIVIKTTGENTKERMYFKLVWTNGYLAFLGYLYWDNVTHAGIVPYQTSTTPMRNTDGLASYTLSVYGDLDCVFVTEKLGHANGPQKLFCGKTDNMLFDDTPGISANPVSAGAGVTVTLDAVPAEWGPNTKVFVLDEEKINIETITSVSGLDVTLDIANSYLAGFAMQGDIGYCASSGYSLLSADFLMDHAGTTDKSLTAYRDTTVDQLDPDVLPDKYGLKSFQLSVQGSYGGRLKHIKAISPTGLVDTDLLIGSSGNYRFDNSYVTEFAIREV